jgi:HlyD family secretion protein
MKKWILIVLLALAAATAAFALRRPGADPATTYATALPARGNMVARVTCTGTLAPVVTVDVGTQVSGTIQQLFADYNSRVTAGQAIARIDPALFEAKVAQTRGAYVQAQANLDKARVTLADAERTLARDRSLRSDGTIAQGELDTAQTARDTARAGVVAAEGALEQTKGAFKEAEVNLANTVIRSPVNGTVINRKVSVGQTVAASLQTPTLFSIAQDLTRMEIDASVDESDIGNVKEGQKATFTVDAYPDRTFAGRVVQVRNAAVTVSNVVTYVAVVEVDNSELLLKPGMTANVAFEVARRENALKVPAAALRFRPKNAPKGDTASAGSRVYVLGENGTLRPVDVCTGITSGQDVEITAGNLAESDRVVLREADSAAAKTSNAPRPPFGF